MMTIESPHTIKHTNAVLNPDVMPDRRNTEYLVGLSSSGLHTASRDSRSWQGFLRFDKGHGNYDLTVDLCFSGKVLADWSYVREGERALSRRLVIDATQGNQLAYKLTRPMDGDNSDEFIATFDGLIIPGKYHAAGEPNRKYSDISNMQISDGLTFEQWQEILNKFKRLLVG